MGSFFCEVRMAFLFQGQFSCKTDLKGRLSLPPLYRVKKEFVLTTNRYRNLSCLDVHTTTEWVKTTKESFEKLQKPEEQEIYQRFYFYSARKMKVDLHSRLLIPIELRKYAQFEKDKKVVLVGMGRKFEIWSYENWKKFYNMAFQGFDTVLSDLALKKESNKGE